MHATSTSAVYPRTDRSRHIRPSSYGFRHNGITASFKRHQPPYDARTFRSNARPLGSRPSPPMNVTSWSFVSDRNRLALVRIALDATRPAIPDDDA